MASVPADPTLFARLGLAFACLFRVLFDAQFAGRIQRLDDAPKLPSQADEQAAAKDRTSDKPQDKRGGASAKTNKQPKSAAKTLADNKPDVDKPSATKPSVDIKRLQRDAGRQGGLLLLGVLQREGRLIDFLQQDIDDFDDDDVGAAARQVHEGCRRALKTHAQVSELHEAEEDSVVTVPADYDAVSFKLTGKVSGKGPFSGKLVHRGWRVSGLKLPELLDGHDGEVVAPAEVEL